MENENFWVRRQEIINALTGTIEKNSENGEYRFADLGAIKKVLDPLKAKYGITDVINFDGFPKKQPYISLYDTRQPEVKEPKLTFYAPIVNATNQYDFQSPLQQVGACMTYYRRYLLMLAYDIAADDPESGKSKEVPEAENIAMDQLMKEKTPVISQPGDGSQIEEKKVQIPQNVAMPEIGEGQQLDMFQNLDTLLMEQREESRPLNVNDTITMDQNDPIEERIFTSGKWKGQPLKNAIMLGDEIYLREVANGVYDNEIDQNTKNICMNYFQ